jgi:hypothetical protein
VDAEAREIARRERQSRFQRQTRETGEPGGPSSVRPQSQSPYRESVTQTSIAPGVPSSAGLNPSRQKDWRSVEEKRKERQRTRQSEGIPTPAVERTGVQLGDFEDRERLRRKREAQQRSGKKSES